MESVGPVILGMQFEIFLMVLAGVFYLVCAGFIWKPYREEKNELISALFVFLLYQASSMFFMGIEMHTMNMAYGNIAALSVLLGSAYMLKFPLRALSERVRKISFLLIVVAVLGIFAWFMRSPESQMQIMHFTLWYDLIINGVIVGGSILLLAFMATERWNRVKALGGGGGVVTCCVAANTAMLSGAFITSSVFGFLAPVIILGTLGFARKKQREALGAKQ